MEFQPSAGTTSVTASTESIPAQVNIVTPKITGEHGETLDKDAIRAITRSGPLRLFDETHPTPECPPAIDDDFQI